MRNRRSKLGRRSFTQDAQRLRVAIASNLSPLEAMVRSRHFLTIQPGCRWIGGSFNGNMLPTALIGSFGLSSTNPDNRIDANRGFQYSVFDSATPTYMEQQVSETWGILGDSGGWSENPGLTVGCWININAMPSTGFGFFAAWNANVNHCVWRLNVESNLDPYKFSVSNSGSYESGQTVTGLIPGTSDGWTLVVGRWDEGAELKLFQYFPSGLSTATNTTSITSDLYNGQYFYIGTHINSSGTYKSADADIGQTFMVNSTMTDEKIEEYYQISRHIYGV